MRKKRIMVSFEDDEMTALEDKARDLDRSISWVIRHLIFGKRAEHAVK